MAQAKQRERMVLKLRALAERLEGMGSKNEMFPEIEKTLKGLEKLVEAAKKAAEAKPEAISEPKAKAKPEQVALSLNDEIEIWCDGSCSPNPGPGGWGAIMSQGGIREELSGSVPSATNNIMEMTAAIKALARTPIQAKIHLTTDSRYLIGGITQWIHDWKKRGWRKADKKPVLNMTLWKELDELVADRQVTWAWVRGHSGHPENERCDELANEARKAQDGP